MEDMFGVRSKADADMLEVGVLAGRLGVSGEGGGLLEAGVLVGRLYVSGRGGGSFIRWSDGAL